MLLIVLLGFLTISSLIIKRRWERPPKRPHKVIVYGSAYSTSQFNLFRRHVCYNVFRTNVRWILLGACMCTYLQCNVWCPKQVWIFDVGKQASAVSMIICSYDTVSIRVCAFAWSIVLYVPGNWQIYASAHICLLLSSHRRGFSFTCSTFSLRWQSPKMAKTL